MVSETQLLLILTSWFTFALAFAVLVNSVFLRFARTLGIRDKQSPEMRWSGSSRPAFGGIGFFIIFLLSFAAAGALLPATSAIRVEHVGLLIATSLGFLMGLADDAYNTRPVLKFGVQVLCAFVLMLSGTMIEIFASPTLNALLTIVWVVGIMNSINMLDNMDGVATLVGGAILIMALCIQFWAGQAATINMVLVIGTTAALAGFLFFNWHPSRIFMGDTGSQFMGVYLAYVGIVCFWNPIEELVVEEARGRQISAILIAFIIPIADTTTVVINRILKGRSPFVGGKDHTTHHLGYLGLSDGQVALVLIGISLASIFLTFVLFRFLVEWKNYYVWFFVFYAVAVASALFMTTKISSPPGPEEQLNDQN